jgi:hypothetical protein
VLRIYWTVSRETVGKFAIDTKLGSVRSAEEPRRPRLLVLGHWGSKIESSSSLFQTVSRDCLESSWTGRIACLSVARSTEKGTLSPVVQAHGTMK